MQGVKDASGLYEVERRACYAARPGFRIVELQISPVQKVPWHYHNKVRDTFYVVEGSIRIFLQDPKEKVELTPGPVLCGSAQTAAPSSPMRVTPPRCFSSSRASANTISLP
jgi:quercetin dioxygenase-like cupin family protein